MKKIIIPSILSVFVLTSCETKTEPQVKKAHHMAAEKQMVVEVTNEIDPVCGMKTSEHLSDTVHYHAKVFGFCSSLCKEEFLEEPEKYINE